MPSAPARRRLPDRRPGKSTPTCTVPAGHFQIETGLADWSLQKQSGERDTSLTIGETTFKYGLTDRSDIEIAGESTSQAPVDYQSVIHAMDLAVKTGFVDVGLTDPAGLAARPQM